MTGGADHFQRVLPRLVHELAGRLVTGLRCRPVQSTGRAGRTGPH